MEKPDELVAPEENLEKTEVPNEPAAALPKLHEFVIEKIQASDKLNEEDKNKALDLLNGHIESGKAKNILLKDTSTEFGSELSALFIRAGEMEFWTKVEAAVWRNENIYPEEKGEK